ncbi:PBECR2 nuclease fold domain-containing protein [Mediterraneibacter gnavus]|uniref:PBECR2 nuclease fold domain-containing protein n=1 Tax=Mediterraneibacter gnavus TaxID=33038 RepID=UPI001FAAFE81|nr:PBECR2 nuclease fold domain-containing protein [Mediterraneibacter gnavus]
MNRAENSALLRLLLAVENDIAEPLNSDIMNVFKTKEAVEVHLVGKINRNIYRCITEDIVTDDVIITENQMQHILDRHPEAYKEVIDYLSDIIQEPDLIIKDKHKNTGLVVKKIKTGNEYAQMVLRICTSNDDPNYKNSVISCWEISEKRLQNYLRNKTILYKKE